MPSLQVGHRLVGSGNPCFIVGDIGINANGSLENALRLIDAAVEAGFDAVKFQKREVPVVYSKEELSTPRAFDRSIIDNALQRITVEGVVYDVFPEERLKRLSDPTAETTNGDLKYALEFHRKDYDTIDRYCREKDILWFASSWDGLSVHFVEGFDPPCHKVASPCLTNKDLLQRIKGCNRPVILSTGGSTLEDVRKAVSLLDREGVAILHCTSTYPSKDEEVNLLAMKTLMNHFPGIPIGYSGHEPDFLPSTLAVAQGACIIERHITLDKGMPGSDQKASLDPEEMKELVNSIRRTEVLCGDGFKSVLPGEASTMKKLRRVNDIHS